MKYQNPIDETVRSLAFLTRIPVPDRYFKDVKPENTSHCAGFYPVAGLLIAALGAIILILASLLGMPNMVSVGLGIIAMIIVTGALHEDGLGDIADGFGGGSTIENRLEIMKDSRLGTYGVIAVISSLFLRVAALTAILNTVGVLAAVCALFASSAASRGAMVWMWSALPNAKSDGVSSEVGQPPEHATSLAAILALSALIIFGIIGIGFLQTSVALGLGILAMLAFQNLCTKMIGGQTGDTLGACQQLVEIAILIGLAIQL